jgi:hypothetical protein
MPPIGIIPISIAPRPQRPVRFAACTNLPLPLDKDLLQDALAIIDYIKKLPSPKDTIRAYKEDRSHLGAFSEGNAGFSGHGDGFGTFHFNRKGDLTHARNTRFQEVPVAQGHASAEGLLRSIIDAVKAGRTYPVIPENVLPSRSCPPPRTLTLVEMRQIHQNNPDAQVVVMALNHHWGDDGRRALGVLESWPDIRGMALSMVYSGLCGKSPRTLMDSLIDPAKRQAFRSQIDEKQRLLPMIYKYTGSP